MHWFLANNALTFSDSEVTFLKFIGYLLPLVWLWYLGKEIISGHRADPAIAELVKAQVNIAASVATLASQSTSNGERITELREMQVRDTQAIFRRLEGLDASFVSALRQHDRELGKLEGAGGRK